MSSPKPATFLFIVVGVEVIVGVLAIHDLRTAYRDAQEVYVGLVQDRRGIGELQSQAQETHQSALYALTTPDAHLRVHYAHQSRGADLRVSTGITRYRTKTRVPQEVEIENRLANDWSSYLRIRDKVLGFILKGNRKYPADMDRTSYVVSYQRVRQDFEEIEKLYDTQASQQIVDLTASSRRSGVKFAAGLAYAVLFGSVAIWVMRRYQTRRAMYLAKGQMDLVAFVSHELRTPLMAILSAGENVRDGLAGRREELTEQGSIIVDQASRMQELVDKVLVLAETTNNKPHFTVRALQVSEILECVLENTAVLIRQSGFTVETKMQPGLPPIIGDLSGISGCLQNFMANAVKYSDKERWIRLSAKLDEASPDGTEVQISVHDRGIGIHSSDLPKIFEPFYRSSRVVAAHIQGTGLGLAIAKRSADAMGAKLSVNSELNYGSVFTLHFPVAYEDGRQLHAVLAGPEVSM